jgi:hypothetical protein
MSAQFWEYLTGQGVIVIGLVLGFLSNRRGVQNVKSDVHDVRTDVAGVHTLVNNQLDRQLDRNAQLTRTLTGAGVDVPPSATAENEGERLARPENHQA